MSEILVKTYTRHRDSESKHFMKDWTAGDILEIKNSGSFFLPDGAPKAIKQMKGALVVRVEDKVPEDFAGGVIYNPELTYENKSFTSGILGRSQKIIRLSRFLSDEQLRESYDTAIVNAVPFLFKGSYLDLFEDRSVRTGLHEEYDIGGSTEDGDTVRVSGGDYTTFFLAEADMPANPGNKITVTADSVNGAVQETGAIALNGVTTTAANYIELKATGASAHAGKYDAAKQIINVANAHTISIYDDHYRLEGLQIAKSSSDAAEANIWIAVVAVDNEIRLSYSILKQPGNDAQQEMGVYCTDGDAILKAWNTVIFGAGILATSNNSCFYIANCATADIYNCTLKDGYRGVTRAAGTVNVYNTISYDNASGALSGTFGTTNYNATDDATGGTNSIDNVDFTTSPYFVNAAAADFTLTANAADVTDATSDQSGGLFSDDIAGNSRTGSWCVGASEYVAAGGVAPTGALYGPLVGPLGGPI